MIFVTGLFSDVSVFDSTLSPSFRIPTPTHESNFAVVPFRSLDQLRLAIGEYQDSFETMPSTVSISDVSTRAPIRYLSGHRCRVRAMCCIDDGLHEDGATNPLIFSCDTSGTTLRHHSRKSVLRVCDPESGKCLTTFDDAPTQVHRIRAVERRGRKGAVPQYDAIVAGDSVFGYDLQREMRRVVDFSPAVIRYAFDCVHHAERGLIYICTRNRLIASSLDGCSVAMKSNRFLRFSASSMCCIAGKNSELVAVGSENGRIAILDLRKSLQCIKTVVATGNGVVHEICQCGENAVVAAAYCRLQHNVAVVDVISGTRTDRFRLSDRCLGCCAVWGTDLVAQNVEWSGKAELLSRFLRLRIELANFDEIKGMIWIMTS